MILIDMNLPSCCSRCKFKAENNYGRCYCYAKIKYLDEPEDNIKVTKERAKWCPLNKL